VSSKAVRRLASGWGLALVAATASCQHAQTAGPKLREFLPALQLPPVVSNSYRVADLPGRVVVVNFFATWCFPCLGQLGLLQRMQRKYGDQGFEVIAIGMDLEGWTVLEPFQSEYQLPFPVLLPNAALREGKTAFGPISALPASFVFGRDGALLSVFGGLPTAEELERLISQALKS
jgi:thiol-disulfide isomerase/thioredoxin